MTKRMSFLREISILLLLFELQVIFCLVGNDFGKSTQKSGTLSMKSVTWLPHSLMPEDVLKSISSQQAEAMRQRTAPLLFSSNKNKSSYFRYSVSRIGFFSSLFYGASYFALDSNSTALNPNLVARKLEKVLEVFEKEWDHIESGTYKMPYDMKMRHRQFQPNFLLQKLLQSAPQGLPVPGRRKRNDFRELPFSIESKLYPDYYMRNFHFQTDGWFSTQSAKSYEFLTELLFSGCQDAMSRGSLIPISRFIQESKVSVADLSFLEVGAGTGRFATFVRDNFPDMQATISDLSPFYLAEAIENDRYWRAFSRSQAKPAKFVQANIEDLPFENGSFDIIAVVNVFHELPPESRRKAVEEMMSVLKPRGIVVLCDSIQQDDVDGGDGSASRFVSQYHEPYYESWFYNEDLDDLFGKCGFVPFGRKDVLSFSKVAAYTKPEEEILGIKDENESESSETKL